MPEILRLSAKAAGGSNLRNAHMVVGNDHWVHLLKGLATHTVLPNALGEAAALEIIQGLLYYHAIVELRFQYKQDH